MKDMVIAYGMTETSPVSLQVKIYEYVVLSLKKLI